jgi:hypothetical protein
VEFHLNFVCVCVCLLVKFYYENFIKVEPHEVLPSHIRGYLEK